MARGNYYVEAIERRDGKRFARTVGRQIKTRSAAFALLDDADREGYVQYWSEREHQRLLVAERDTAGVWRRHNPHTGDLEIIEPSPRIVHRGETDGRP